MSQSDRIEYAVYDIATGVVQRVGECSDDDLILQAGEGQHVIAALPDGFDDSAVYWDGTGWAEYPERPYSHLQWDGMQWVDPRDPAQIAAALIAARYATNAPRDTVFYGLYQAGAYPAADLADDSSFLPATFEEYLTTLPDADRAEVKAALKYEPNIWRLHPHLIGGEGVTGFIPWLAAEKGITITEDQLDQIFDVPVPAPIYNPA